MDVARTDATPGYGRPRACGFLAALSMAALVGTTAPAQPPAPRSGGPAAILLPPRAAPDTSPFVARGVMHDTLTPLDRTPVRRPAAHATAGPAWLQDDAGVVPAGGAVTAKSAQPRPAIGMSPRSVVSASEAADPASAIDRGLNRLKGFVTAEPPVVPFNTTQSNPAGEARPEMGPRTPHQRTGPNGSQVYAGPPAWRWYGYGSVTPGANNFAPSGEYPKASANWYSVTQATPGAFPVPVMHPYRPAPGNEPPTYTHTRTQAPPSLVGDGRASGSVPGVSPRSAPATTPEPGKAPLPSKFSVSDEPTSQASPRLGGIPTMSPPPMVIPPPVAAASATPLPVQGPAPLAVIPPLQPVTAMPVEPALPTRTEVPASLPVKSAEGVEWQSSPNQPRPATPGQWQSAPGR